MSGSPPTAGTLPISAVIITHNESRRLPATLASVDLCAERLVVDSGSNDGTVEIAHASGARVEHQPFLGYGPQKRGAVELAAHDWILSIDADEMLDDEARSAVAAADLADPAACYAFRRRTYIGPREIRHGAWRNQRVLRLFNRTTAGFLPLPVHERVVTGRRPAMLAGSIVHRSYTDCADVVARALRYAPLKAGLLRDRRPRPRAWMLPLRGLAAFLQSYAVRGGWRDGGAGFVVAVCRVLDSTLPRALLIEEATAAADDATGIGERSPSDGPPRPLQGDSRGPRANAPREPDAPHA
jgi:glycosyltransferase involved in cell wall biosynthesis